MNRRRRVTGTFRRPVNHSNFKISAIRYEYVCFRQCISLSIFTYFPLSPRQPDKTWLHRPFTGYALLVPAVGEVSTRKARSGTRCCTIWGGGAQFTYRTLPFKDNDGIASLWYRGAGPANHRLRWPRMGLRCDLYCGASPEMRSLRLRKNRCESLLRRAVTTV